MTELKNGTLIVSRQTGKVGVLMTDGEQHYLVNGREHMMVLPQFIRAYDPDADRVKLSLDEQNEVAAMNRDMENAVYIGKNIGDAMKSRFKPFIVECEAEALIKERWRIMARNAAHAEELFENGETGEFIDDATIGEETDRTFMSATLEEADQPISVVGDVASANRAVIDETLEDARRGGVATSYKQLHAGLEDMIFSGRLSGNYIPDDFEWLSASLSYLTHHPKLTSEG